MVLMLWWKAAAHNFSWFNGREKTTFPIAFYFNCGIQNARKNKTRKNQLESEIGCINLLLKPPVLTG
jgi:hypothetical protein